MDDLISRAGAIKAICEDGTKLEREGRYILLMASRKQRDADILSALPSVDAVPVRRGNWVGIDQEPCEMWECDRCGYVEECEDGEQTDFCPGCGADMREVDDE